jgi:hypothetical protein
MGFIHDTEDEEFRGITLETRRESIILGFNDALHPEDIGKRQFVEIAYEDIDALRLALDMAELPKLPKGWFWERADGLWQARGPESVLVGIDADGDLGALDREGEPVDVPDVIRAVAAANNFELGIPE